MGSQVVQTMEEMQQHEIMALKSIYAEDFIECPPPKAWKGAARLPEFIIYIPHPDPTHAQKICLFLNIKFPKTYPKLAPATFTIQKPAKGLSHEQYTKLSHDINVETQKFKGAEMVFQMVNFCQDWLLENVKPTVEAMGSLAKQMTERANQEERARREQEEEQAQRERLKAEEAARELKESILMEDAMRQMMAQEEEFRFRKRANSEATEVPISGDTLTETFLEEVNVNGVHFHTVKLFHPRTESLGIIFKADPMCDDVNITLPLELYAVTFESPYYSSAQGRKKLKQLELEIHRLTTIRHKNLLSVFAVKLHMPYSRAPAKLLVLTEPSPALLLQDILDDCDSLRPDRCSNYLGQILTGLNSIHVAELVHRGINANCIGLVTSNDESSPYKLIKIGKVGYFTKLLDLHRSNSFGPRTPAAAEELHVPDSWLSLDVMQESSLLYTRQRDLHAVGVVLLQMILGLDVMKKFHGARDAIAALDSSDISPLLARQASSMLLFNKKGHVTCISLLGNLADSSFDNMNSAMSSSPDLRTPVAVKHSSPEMEYFRMPNRAIPSARQASRWKDDYEELELLGKGAFGSVVKARNKIDNRIYAVKKIRLRFSQSDNKIFREVNALSRLSHRFIVRYYTTWVETADTVSTTVSDDSSAESGTDDGLTSVPVSMDRNQPVNGAFVINMDDFDDLSRSTTSIKSNPSFPSIIFEPASPPTSGDDSSGEGLDSLFKSTVNALDFPSMTPPLSRTLYIQMEFVERQTLKERIDEGISEGEAWRLFQQIVDALVHMSALGILHRDIKLTNIFIDANNDCKVGDFGLATSSLAAVDPSDVSLYMSAPDGEMTMEVGTRLYIAPEVQTRRRGTKNQSKADMYSLGIVFFEMNYRFSTGAERIAVIEDLRRPGITFPYTWDIRRVNQKAIISWLLKHEPDERPSALELTQSKLMPPRVEDEHFKDALGVMTKPDSPHHQMIISSLFNQPPRATRNALYDQDADPYNHASLNNIVQDRLVSIFRLHGAVDMEPPLLMPLGDVEELKNRAAFIDQHGDVVTLPHDVIVPFARLASRTSIKRIKRYHISNVFKPSLIAGHPKAQKSALIDIITEDLEWGPIAAAAEIIAVINDVLNSYPNLRQTFEIYVSHSKIVEHVMSRVPSGLRNAVADILNQSRSSSSQKRSQLIKKGVLRNTADELETLAESDENLDNIITRLEKISPLLRSLLQPAFDELKDVVEYATATGVKKIIFYPLMLGNHLSNFKDGVLVEVVKQNKRTDVLASGGRYDHLITHITTSASGKVKPDPLYAIGLEIAMERITQTLASYQSISVKTLVKDQRSFGYWSPRRCDVYVVSYHANCVKDRLEVVSYLWEHNISADLMYETGLPDAEKESYVELCTREGILFTVFPRPRNARREQAAFKVKSILKGTEYEMSRAELVPWLHLHIMEQKKLDMGTSGAPIPIDHLHAGGWARDPAAAPDIQLLVPIDVKKHKKTKPMYIDRAFHSYEQVKKSVHEGISTLALDVPPAVFDAMVRSSAWVTEDEDSWKNIVSASSSPSWAYLHQVREAVAKRKADGQKYVLLFAVRESRIQLLSLM